MRIVKILLLCCALLMTQVSLASAFDVYLVRHFEKQKIKDNPSLTETGQKRARQLARMLKEVDLSVVYSSDYNRTRQTATPTANIKNLPVTLYDPGDLRALAEKVKGHRQAVLIVGHSNTTPAVIKLLGGEAKPISEKDYGELFKLTFNQGVVSTVSEQVTVD